MANMMPVTSLGGKQFLKARSLKLPVSFDGFCFRVRSAGGGEGEHEVRFDSDEEPLLYSCTCRAGATGTPCWAAARALDALTVLGLHNIRFARGAQAASAPPAPVPPPLRASVGEDGDLELMVAREARRDVPGAR